MKQALRSPRWQPQPIALSGVTDPYKPLERRLQLTRQCLDVLRAFRNPVVIITKNHLVTRDLDLLSELAHYEAVMVYLYAGARHAGSIPVRLPLAVGPLFEQWLSEHYPTKMSKVLNRIKAMHGGKLNDPRFGSRMRGEGIFAQQLYDLFRLSCRKVGISSRGPTLSTAAFQSPGSPQLSLFTPR